ncbi:DUF2971 domain-containing protein [Alteromonas sp. H39]|uniref:DUF2971 domain-containing protein n=1 Tax=Alteromonas sp. H39 TaxID=3389876 RepID=UPI0039E0A838
MDPLILETAQDHPTAYESGLEALYRYSSYSPDCKDRHSYLFREGWLYHSQPESFNDPFDCKYHLRWPNALFYSDELRGFLGDMQLLAGLLPEQVNEDILSRSLGILSNDGVKANVKSALEIEYSKARVCCFTSTNDNQLFWSHYANSHKGYCVKFAVSDNSKSVISNARKIKYTDDYPTLTFPLFSKLVKLLKPFYTKSKKWEYEGEYRSIFSHEWLYQLEHSEDALKLSNDEITDVYFGSQMLPEDKADIIELCEQGPFKPRLWDSMPHPSKYELSFIPHEG